MHLGDEQKEPSERGKMGREQFSHASITGEGNRPEKDQEQKLLGEKKVN